MVNCPRQFLDSKKQDTKSCSPKLVFDMRSIPWRVLPELGGTFLFDTGELSGKDSCGTPIASIAAYWGAVVGRVSHFPGRQNIPTTSRSYEVCGCVLLGLRLMHGFKEGCICPTRAPKWLYFAGTYLNGILVILV